MRANSRSLKGVTIPWKEICPAVEREVSKSPMITFGTCPTSRTSRGAWVLLTPIPTLPELWTFKTPLPDPTTNRFAGVVELMPTLPVFVTETSSEPPVLKAKRELKPGAALVILC